MSKKQLLTEGEIRRFMKYANLGPLSENFLSENIYEEEEGDMGDMPPVDDMQSDMPPVDGVEGDMPAPQGNVEVEEGELARLIKDAVKAALAEAGVGSEAAPEGDMDVTGGEEMPPEEGEEEEEEEGAAPMDESRMVSEVARRVMARLSESRKPQTRRSRAPARPARAPARRSRAAAINEVTDRIMKRILKGK
jgi:hypothetical protein